MLRIKISDTTSNKMVLYLVNYRNTFKLPCIVAAADPTESKKDYTESAKIFYILVSPETRQARGYRIVLIWNYLILKV